MVCCKALIPRAGPLTWEPGVEEVVAALEVVPEFQSQQQCLSGAQELDCGMLQLDAPPASPFCPLTFPL